MKNKLKGNDTYLVSKVMYEIKFREFINDLRDSMAKESKLNKEIETIMLMSELIFFVGERLFLAKDSIEELLKSILNLDDEKIKELDHQTKVQEIVSIFIEAIPSVVWDYIDLTSIKKKLNDMKENKELEEAQK